MNKDKIALIGMPGCGKSTIGKALKDKIGYNLIDLDELIVKLEGKCIDDIFAGGEDVFRKAESRALKESAKESGKTLVSTGGGIVKIPENINILREEFIVIFIDRSIDDIFEDIDTDSRPLLKNNKGALIDLYNERYDLYKKASHIYINNKGNIFDVIDNIVKEIENYQDLSV